MDMYGVCKCFAEAAAHYFAAVEGLSCIAVRIGAFGVHRIEGRPNARDLSVFVSEADMIHLLVRCIEAPNVQFAIAHGVSNNRFKRLDISSARELLGYRPQDDAFQIAGLKLRYTEEWGRKTSGGGGSGGASEPVE